MIGFRNRLAHFQTPTMTLTDESSVVKIRGAKAHIELPLPVDPWKEISVAPVLAPRVLTNHSGDNDPPLRRLESEADLVLSGEASEEEQIALCRSYVRRSSLNREETS